MTTNLLSPPAAARKRARRSPLRSAACLALSAALGLATPPALAQAGAPPRLPALGDAATEDLSIGDERRLGEQIMREVRRDPDFLDDPVLLAYVQSLWQPLVRAARERGDIDDTLARQFPWEIFLVRDRSVNAFAFPGGYVGVHLGLVAITSNRDQLASVLAHELTHVTQRHIARGIGNARSTSLVGLAAMLLGVLAASRANNVDVANAAIMSGQGAMIQGQLNFSRDMEREADRIGYAVLTGAGFSAGGMAQMFERLQGNAAVADSGAFPYLRTHPLTIERISEARSRTLLAGREGAPGPTLMHTLMQARARVLMDRSTPALQRLTGGATASAQPADRIAALYAAALAQAQLGNGVAAEDLAQQALRQARALGTRDAAAERALVIMQAEARLAANDGAGAWRVLEGVEAAGTAARVGRSTPAPGAGTGAGSGAADGAAERAADSAPERAADLAPGRAAGREADGAADRTTDRTTGRAADHAAGSGSLATPAARTGADRSLLTLRARAALRWHERDAAGAAPAVRASTEALQTWLSEHAQDAAAWELLAGTAEALGQKLRSMRAGAEARAAVGDLGGAIDRLRAAQAASRAPAAPGGGAPAAAQPDFIDASIIDTRLRQLLEERRQLALEARQRGGGGDGR